MKQGIRGQILSIIQHVLEDEVGEFWCHPNLDHSPALGARQAIAMVVDSIPIKTAVASKCFLQIS